MRTILAALWGIVLMAGCSSPSPSSSSVPRDRLDVIVRNLSAAPASLSITAPGGSPSGADSTALACNLAAVSVGAAVAWEVSVDETQVLSSTDPAVPELGNDARLEIRITVDATGTAAVDEVRSIPFDGGIFNDGSALRGLMPTAEECAS